MLRSLLWKAFCGIFIKHLLGITEINSYWGLGQYHEPRVQEFLAREEVRKKKKKKGGEGVTLLSFNGIGKIV